ncbi:hypothetical protein P0240_16630 [Enterobacter cloacae]|uniref:hypothetical protein n=1 Tax=Enterobacter cloacae complex TaxID=354276 RepID=UPI00065183F0|nr:MULTISPECIES: hypothetical protein [Enterobacter cloacae complex]HDT3786033.1 hypothetical protein [Enterobacter hormaechei subsp. steigerwaltii]KLW09138.1 hypothetical protein SK45_00426 [Enterobacter hormaechei]KLW11087.1 hypothetical protein SK46_02890 [Enterobacter hormaechei]MCM7399112.1 hypothetical protein [Enterobacter cloacae]QGN44395.1 hypothetical protein GJ694_20265 [Enterobacter cloacae]
MDLSKSNFYNFIDQYVEITGASPSTAGNVRSVCYLVKAYISDTATADTWDTNSIINTYVMANGIAEDTQKSYISRFNGAVAKFIAHEKGEDVTVKQRRSPVKTTQSPMLSAMSNAAKTFELPIPLREELIVMISNLPRDLTKDEAKRISNIVESFAVSQPAND